MLILVDAMGVILTPFTKFNFSFELNVRMNLKQLKTYGVYSSINSGTIKLCQGQLAR